LNFTFKILSKPALDWFSKNCTCLCKGPLNTRKGKQFGTSLKQETLNHHHTCGISLEVFSMNGALAQPCIACKSLAKVVWPPAILLTGDTESYTFIRGGHRTWNVPKVSGNLNDAELHVWFCIWHSSFFFATHVSYLLSKLSSITPLEFNIHKFPNKNVYYVLWAGNEKRQHKVHSLTVFPQSLHYLLH
jgi:hypothetical protein